jgi:hypothetical protein
VRFDAGWFFRDAAIAESVGFEYGTSSLAAPCGTVIAFPTPQSI